MKMLVLDVTHSNGMTYTNIGETPQEMADQLERELANVVDEVVRGDDWEEITIKLFSK